MIDTHAHLHLPDYAADRDRVLTRTFAIGVGAIVEASIGEESWPLVETLARSDPRIFATLGIHPHEADSDSAPALARLARRARDFRPVAIGETGMDRVRSRTRREDQQLVFRSQIHLARELELPLVIHCRDAFQDLLRVLDDEGGRQVGGVFHCFSGGRDEALEVIERGFAIGLAGGVTYAADRWTHVLHAIPIESILLETDSPFLKPAPNRHGRNELGFIFETTRAVAQILDRPPAEVERIADANAARVFRLPAQATRAEK
jgi:TatD DNase family protein